MQWLIGLCIVTLLLLYIFIIRPVIVNAPVFSTAFKREASLLDCIRIRLLGWKTKIMSRLVMLMGVFVGIYPFAMGQDWTPITKLLPDWALPVGLMLMGFIFDQLRRATESPIQVVTQKLDDGAPQVVALIKPGS